MLDILFTIAGIAAIILIWIMLYDSNRFVVVQHAFCDARIRKPFRFVVLADLHDNQYGRENGRLAAAIREQKPDAVLVAGDMLTAKPGKKHDRVIALFRQLAEEYPIYYANGNHEYRLKIYPDVYEDDADKFEDALSNIGIHRLVNERVILPEVGISIYGSEIDRYYYRRFRVGNMDGQYLEQLLGPACDQQYNILLAHNPDYFSRYAEWGADLVLSGHIHGGIVRIPGGKGVLSPAIRFFPKYDGGIFREGESTMLLSRGLGLHTIPFRLFNPGELLVVDLKPTE